MMNLMILLYVIYIVAAIFALISIVGVVYAIYSGRDFDKNPLFRASFFNKYFFSIGCWMVIGLILGYIFYNMLFFIPDSWGYIDEEGEWQSVQYSVAVVLALIISTISVTKIEKYLECRIAKKEKERLGY